MLSLFCPLVLLLLPPAPATPALPVVSSSHLMRQSPRPVAKAPEACRCDQRGQPAPSAATLPRECWHTSGCLPAPSHPGQAPPPAVQYPQLSKTLDSLAYVDQWPMQQMFKQLPDSAGRNLEQVEQANFARHQPVLEKIVRHYGFPGFRQVGQKSAGSFWLLVQHADAHPEFQRRVLQLMRPEVKRKNASAVNYAYLTDRVAVNAGQPEEYGTQVKYEGTGLDLKAVPRSLRDPAQVNKRRAAIGMEPLENYLEMMNKLFIEMNHPKAQTP